MSVKVLSRQGKVPQSYVRKWLTEENWSTKESVDDKVVLSAKTKRALKSSAERFNLTEQEELFCYHYLKTLNATTSAVKAGYSPAFCYQKGHILMKNSKIKEFLNHIKGIRNQELFIDPIRIIKEYMKIAFADMTDFVKFGPNGLTLKNSDKVDGQLITKLKEGREGISIELADKLKALDKLEKYLEVMPGDRWKKDIEERKLALLMAKMETGGEEEKDDGFLEALGNSAKEVWEDEG